MSVSRRNLLKNTAFAALVGLARPLYSWSGHNNNSGGKALQPLVNNNLSHLNRKLFTQVVGSSFKVTEERGNSSPVYLRLIAVEDLPPLVPVDEGAMAVPPPKINSSQQTDGYVLIFSSSLPKPLPQGTYEFEHARLGSFSLLIVPGGGGFQTYCAVINHLV
jgi:hypothetical protein